MKSIKLEIQEDKDGYLDVIFEYKGFLPLQALEVINEVKESLVEDQIRMN